MHPLPLFPLNTVLFPGTPIHLHIFEERYKLMMRNVLEGNRLFGVALIRNGLEAHGPLAEPFTIGCSARIVDLERLPDGCMNLVAVGEERFRIHTFDHGAPYLIGNIESIPIDLPRTLEIVRGSQILREQVKHYLRILSTMTNDQENSEEFIETQTTLNMQDMLLPDDPTAMLFIASALLQIPAVEKQTLLEEVSASSLLKSLMRLYKRESCVNSHLMNKTNENARRSSWLN